MERHPHKQALRQALRKNGKRTERPARSWAADVGPGLATIGSDNDPSGIATYTLAGAWYRFDLLWVCVLTYPSMVALQLISARVASITSKGLTDNMREHYAPVFFYFAVARFLLANTFNIAVDILAMGTAARAVMGGSVALLSLLCGGASLILQWCVPYARYARVIQWLTLGMFAYVGVILLLHVPWHTVAIRAFIPRIVWTKEYTTMMLALFGTTVSPYLLFSQAEQEVEERQEHASSKPSAGSDQELRKLRRDTLLRTALSNAAAIAIMIASAAAFQFSHHAPGESVALERVLEPLAHGFAPQVLALALLGSALLALPPLAGSAAQAAASSFDWQHGEKRNTRIAALLLVITAIGAAVAITLAMIGIDPVIALYWSALVNGMTITPVLVLLVLLSSKREAVGDLVAHWSLRVLCWLTTIAAGAALIAHSVLEFF
ncbi:NRAMP family divalent metal transporter [Paraburkholderia sabiae]|uniref:Divalent metal cation transporter n=1 Tax=Paraburkholderia sabiae TaxID=273251 RepID=A0ABU9Q8V6_9BURK|nr:divalent metal cation transporter [Paraburkholderia sabiae]WJZ78414.1 divalent metal cation transporter [Paraburkholderia sabiae]CAD6508300.1 Divalent metal cation transporter MntH [Paraburkholderia sabiae]